MPGEMPLGAWGSLCTLGCCVQVRVGARRMRLGSGEGRRTVVNPAVSSLPVQPSLCQRQPFAASTSCCTVCLQSWMSTARSHQQSEGGRARGRAWCYPAWITTITGRARSKGPVAAASFPCQ